MFVNTSSGELIQSGHITQQRRTGGVDVDTDKIHTGLYDFVERVLKRFGFHIVLVEANPATVQFTSSASKVKYQPRRYNLPAEFIPTTDEADDYCRYVAAQIDEPFPVLTAEFDANESQAAIQEVLDRDVSDKVALTLIGNSGLGINENFFIERIRVRVSESNVVHYRAELSPATVTGLIIVLDTGPGLDTGILGY